MTSMTTTSGRIRGERIASGESARPHVERYLGVPFAGSAAGDGRWRAPSPAPEWTGELDATRVGPASPQNPDPMAQARGRAAREIDEAACLTLNIWTPGSDDARRPVLLWTHGGAYVGGSNADPLTVGAGLAAAGDVVVVAANYRLGALGFLALDHLLGDEYRDAANLAVLDQLAALEWVRAHIDRFGGDPANITLMGQSAGGAMVATMLGAPASEGLFRRAIIQSGTAERARPLEESRAVTAEFLDILHIDERDAERLLTLPLDDVLSGQARLLAQHAERAIGLPMPFQPSMGTSVLPVLPVDAVRAGRNRDVELLVGTNLNESSFVTAFGLSGRAPREMTARVLDSAPLSVTVAEYAAAVAADTGEEANELDVLESAITDRAYRQPTNRLLDARLAAGSAATFAYLFTWPSPMMGGVLGACHTLEIPFVFRAQQRPEAHELVGADAPASLSHAMSSAWVAFATRGTPHAADAPGRPAWPEYTADRRATMRFDASSSVVDDPLGAIRKVWLP